MRLADSNVARERAGDEPGGPDALAYRLLLEAVDCIAQASRLVADERLSAALSDRAQELDQFARGVPGSRG